MAYYRNLKGVTAEDLKPQATFKYVRELYLVVYVDMSSNYSQRAMTKCLTIIATMLFAIV